MGSGKGETCVTTGFRYFAGLHLVFCHGLDSLLGIRVGEKWAWTGSVAANGAVSINKPELFGGEGREGGVRGTVDACFGLASQPRNSYLQSVLGANVPAFRGLFALVARKCMLSANNPYIKEWAILGRRTRIGWRDDLADIVAADGYVDMNPAHIIRETLTNTTWGGMGYPEADLDGDAFNTAATLLHAEGFGLSLLWAKNTSVEDFLKIILDHIDGKLYYSHITGLLKLKLVRNDYNIGGIPVLSESNILELIDYTGPAATESINQVVVNYVDRENNPCAVTVQDLAGITRMGGQINSTTLNFVGIADGSLAAKVAARELQQLCQPISSCTLVINRKQSLLEPGDCFNFCWGPLGIENMAMRVDTVEIGLHTDSSIRIVAVRDVYGLGAVTITEPANSLWSSSLNEPASAVRRKIHEITWWQFVREYAGESEAVLAELDDSSTLLTCFCGRPSSDALNYELWTRNVGATDWVKRDTDSFPFTGTLAVAVPPAVSSVLQLQEGMLDTDLVQVGTYAALGSELVAVTAIDPVNVTVTVNRGVLDTIPVAHAAGEYLWFHQGFYGLDKEDRAVGESVEVKILPSTSLGRLGLEDAAADVVSCVGRMMRPYPPGNVQVNGSRWPQTIGANEGMIITWSHRNRLAQTITLVRQDGGDIGPEAGVSYTLRFYGDGDLLLREATGVTATSYTYTVAMEAEDLGIATAVTYADLMTAAAPSHWWRLAETSGTSLVSAVGGWTATLSGSGYTLGAAGLLRDDANKAIAWGANADQYAQADLHTAHLLGTGDFAVSMMVKYTSTSFATLLAVRNGTTAPMLVLVTSSRITAGDISAETWAWETITTRVRHPGVNDGNPHHVVVNYKHATTMLELWVDGVLRDSRSQGSGRPTSGAANVFIGNNSNLIQGFTSGAQDEIAMFGRALAQTEIENLADVALNGPRAGSGVLNSSLRVELESARNSLVSLQKWNLSVTRGEA